ncbi:MAG: nucleotide sugar dehydrogenase [Candidatus Omnitrophota bacterium]
MKKTNKKFNYDIAIVGGLGHVGLPLGIVFAAQGMKVALYDLNQKFAKIVKGGKMPFVEYDAEPLLKKALARSNLVIQEHPRCLSGAKIVIIAVGTPVDEYLNPKVRQFLDIFNGFKKFLNKNQLIVIRSTVYPHTCEQLRRVLGGGDWKIAYCPERIIQGYAVRELRELPQIVSGMTKDAEDAAAQLFDKITPKIIRVSVRKAELAKLFSNAWRYIQFAVTNQFYMIASDFGVDYQKVRRVMMEGYGRAATLPTAGFAAGPCLLKDTMQLAAFSNNNFLLGHSAMMINEGLPNFLVNKLREKYDLSKTRVGILGMAFKADIDDSRDSLSYKLGKILRFHGAKVYYSDEYVKDKTFVSKAKLLKLSDIVIIGVPHSAYGNLKISPKKEIIDLWGIITK